MAIKESSDELNPAVVVPPSTVAVSKTPWNPVDYLALAIATWGVGYLPLMPGTFGSLVGVGIFLLLSRTAVGLIVSILAITFAGIWAGSRTEELTRKKDPGKVVVDEVAGQLIATLPLAFFTQWSIAAVMVSFVLFRFFDIVKPYPANRFEEFKGGFGIMCDDLVAGVYAAVLVSIFVRFF
ncbi:MAG TPA: phosphatidylglycerophosphatase A [Pyrinomonadaceae bacterium]|nr:phosphatidylglycerophosphatase A [Pyrinomonadaceae bacterium]